MLKKPALLHFIQNQELSAHSQQPKWQLTVNTTQLHADICLAAVVISQQNIQGST